MNFENTYGGDNAASCAIVQGNCVRGGEGRLLVDPRYQFFRGGSGNILNSSSVWY